MKTVSQKGLINAASRQQYLADTIKKLGIFSRDLRDGKSNTDSKIFSFKYRVVDT